METQSQHNVTAAGLIQIINNDEDCADHNQVDFALDSSEDANLVEDEVSDNLKINTMNNHAYMYRTSGTGSRSMFPQSSVPEQMIKNLKKPAHKGHQESVH